MDYQELVERLNITLDGLKDGLDDWPIASHIWEYEQAIKAIESLQVELTKYRDAPVVAWVEVVDSYEGPYHFNGEKLLNVGKHKLIVKPGEEK